MRVGVSRPLGSWCPTALQFVLTWSMAPVLARCHEGQLSLKFDCVFVPVDFMHCASYGFPFIDLLYSDQCNSEDVSFSILFVGNAGHFDAVIDLACSKGLEGLLEIQGSRILELCCLQTFDNEINLAGSESLEGLKFGNIELWENVPSSLWFTVQAVV